MHVELFTPYVASPAYQKCGPDNDIWVNPEASCKSKPLRHHVASKCTEPITSAAVTSPPLSSGEWRLLFYLIFFHADVMLVRPVNILTRVMLLHRRLSVFKPEYFKTIGPIIALYAFIITLCGSRKNVQVKCSQRNLLITN